VFPCIALGLVFKKARSAMGDWKTPGDLKYTESDEWIRVEGDEAVIGITDYAQDQLSDLVYVEFPEVGDTFGKGEAFGVVESVKASADVYMPIGGEIIAVNEALEDEPELINGDAYGVGWLVRIRPGDLSQLGGLFDAAAYAKHCEERQ
jgi:glycine cleavage system H protein